MAAPGCVLVIFTTVTTDYPEPKLLKKGSFGSK
jgi:hypothetical protein